MNQTTTISTDPSSIIQELVQAPVFLSQEHIQETVVPSILGTIVGVTLVYGLVFALFVNRLIPNDDKNVVQNRRKLAYQMTNGITNLGLGLMGLYYQFYVLPESASTQQRIEGLSDLYILGAIQIGFQIWSIVIGLLWVDESTHMLFHHGAVIMASAKSVFMTNGFRYYAPIALGMTELSSVPLSVMNAFKDNAAWREANPQGYLASRLLFSLAFLGIRIVIFVPQHLEYLRLTFLMNYFADTQHVGLLYRAYMGIAWVGGIFLLVLQLYWGCLIVNGLSKFAFSKVQIKSTIVDKKKTV